jgi:hypothetical protein
MMQLVSLPKKPEAVEYGGPLPAAQPEVSKKAKIEVIELE